MLIVPGVLQERNIHDVSLIYDKSFSELKWTPDDDKSDGGTVRTSLSSSNSKIEHGKSSRVNGLLPLLGSCAHFWVFPGGLCPWLLANDPVHEDATPLI